MNFRFPSDSPASVARRAAAIERERKVVVKTTRGSVFEEYLRNIGHPAATPQPRCAAQKQDGAYTAEDAYADAGEQAAINQAAYAAQKPGEWCSGFPVDAGVYEVKLSASTIKAYAKYYGHGVWSRWSGDPKTDFSTEGGKWESWRPLTSAEQAEVAK